MEILKIILGKSIETLKLIKVHNWNNMLGKFIKYLNNIKLKKQKSKIHYLKLLFEVDFLNGIFN